MNTPKSTKLCRTLVEHALRRWLGTKCHYLHINIAVSSHFIFVYGSDTPFPYMDYLGEKALTYVHIGNIFRQLRFGSIWI